MMNTRQQSFIRDSQTESDFMLSRLGPLLQLNTLWAGSPNYDGLITQQEIDSVPEFVAAGLTVQELADAEFALATIKDTINNALPALTVLAKLPGG